jgi:hypothetical protein
VSAKAEKEGRKMLYSEFLEGVGCPDRQRNYEVYKKLESLYMSDDSMTKEAVYEAGKSLVDWSKSQTEIDAENAMAETIATIRRNVSYETARIDVLSQDISSYNARMKEYYWDRDEVEYLKSEGKRTREIIKTKKLLVKELKNRLSSLKQYFPEAWKIATRKMQAEDMTA